MAVEILVNATGYHFPKTGPWGSKENEEALTDMQRLFDECIKAGNEYVVLIESHHECTKGYWIELKKVPTMHPDIILKKFEK